jgi:hypothetical protein
MMLAPPIIHLEQIDLAEANRALAAWQHRIGACHRPNAAILAHGIFAHGNVAAVTVTASLISEKVSGLSRDQALELARLCAARPRRLVPPSRP